MANNLEDVYIRIKLDAAGSQQEVLQLEEAFDKLQKKLKQYQDPDTKKIKDRYKKDPEVQNLVDQWRKVDTLVKQNRQWIQDINDMIRHISDATLKQLRHGVKQLNQEMRDLTRAGADIAKIEEVQRKMTALQNEIKRRNAENQPLVQNIQKLTKLTADELARSVKESMEFVRILPKGSAEMRQMLSLNMRFREQQAKINGEMTYGRASRLASGSARGDLSQLNEAAKTLQRYREELGQFMNSSMFTKLNDNINNIKNRTLEMARAIASGTMKASYADMQTALGIIDTHWKSLNPSVKGNAKLIGELQGEYRNLKATMDSIGKQAMTRSDAMSRMAEAQQLLAKGTKADATEVRYYIEQMQKAQTAEKMRVADVQQVVQVQKQLNALLQEAPKTKSRKLSDILGDLSKPQTLGQLEALKKELQELMKSMTDGASAQKATKTLADIQSRIDNFGKVPEKLRPFKDMLAQLGTPQTLGQLQGLKKEMEMLLLTLTDGKKAQQVQQALTTIKEKIDNFGKTQPKSRGLSAIIGDLATPQTLGQLEALKKELQELMKSMTDGASAQKATKTLADIQSRIDNFGKVPEKLRPFKDMLAQLATPQTLGQLQGLKKEMEMLLLTLTDGKKAQQVQQAIGTIKQQIDNFGKTQPKFRPMKEMFADLAQPQTLEGLRNLKKEMEALLATVKDGGKAQQLTANIAKADQMIESFGKKTITAKEAARAYSDGQVLLAKGTSASADAVRRVIDSMEQAAKMTGLNLSQEQQYIAMKRELTQLLQGQNTVTMSATDAMLAYTKAEQLLAQGGQADAVAVRQMVETMKQAAMAAGLNVEDSNRMVQMQKQLYDALTKVQEPTAAMRSLGEVIRDVHSAKTLGDMEKLRTELQALFKTISDPGQAQLARTELDKLDTSIKNFGRVTVDAMAVMRNPENFNLSQINAAIKQLEERFNNINVNKSTEAFRKTLGDSIIALKEYATEADKLRKGSGMSVISAAGFALGADGSLTQLREAMKVLQEFRDKSIKTSDTAALAQYNKYIADLKTRIDEATKSASAMDVQMAKWLANGSVTGTVAELQEAKKVLEQFKQTLQTTDKTGLQTINDELKLIDKQLDAVNGKTKQVMTQAGANTAYSDAQLALRAGKSGDAQNVRNLIQLMKEAQGVQGISIQQSHQYAAMERELTELLKVKAAVTMNSYQADQAYSEAQNLIWKGQSASAASVREYIELMKQAQLVETNSVADKQRYAEMQKKLEEQLRGTAAASMTYAQAMDVWEKKEGATVGELQKAIESLRILASQEHITLEEQTKYNKLLQTLEGRLKGTSSAAKELAYDEKFVADTLKNIKKAPMEDLEKAATMLKNRLRDSQTSLKDFIKASLDLKKTQSALRGVTQEVRSQETAFSKAITKLMNYLGIFGGFYLVRQKLTQAFQANLKYDESLTNIRKTTGLTSEAVAMLADNIKRIDTRTALQDMNDLAYSAGKLGVKGVSDVMGFVRAADKIKIALGEQLGDSSEAIEQLMKITNIMGVQQQYGLEESITRTGSALNYLTMNSQATAQPMVDFMKRIAGISTQAGVTAAELTGLAGAVNALGQPVEMSATSISKMMVQISGHSQQVAKALQMTAEETKDFMYSISSGQMMDALLMVLQKTNEAGGLSHLSTIVKDLGSSGQRVIQTIATLSENYETVSKMVRMSTNAFDEGTSVIDEYNLKQQNTAALWEKLKNNMSKLMVSTDAVDYIHDILEELQGFPEAFRGMAISMKPVFELLKNLAGVVVECSWAITGMFKAMLLHTVLVKVATLLKPVITLFTTFRTVLIATGSALKGFSAALRTLSWGNVFTAAFTVIFALWDKWAQKQDRIKRNMEESIELLERTKNQAAETTANTEAMISKLKSANEETGERKKIIDQLNQTYGSYLGHQLTEAMNNDAIAESLRQVNKELRLKALLEGQAQMNEEIDASYRDQQGAKKTSLIDEIAGFIETNGSSKKAARSVAATVAERLLTMQADGTRFGASLLDKTYDDDGNVTGYSIKKTSQSYGARKQEVDAAQQSVRDLIDQALIDYNKNNETKLSRGKNIVGSILSSVIDYLDVEVQRDSEKREKNVAWDDDIRTISEQAKAKVVQDVKDYWDVISNTVTQGGKFATEYVSEDIKSKDKDLWIARKNGFTPKQRQEEENMVKGFLNRIDDYMKVVQGEGRRYKAGMPQVEANESDEYKELRARQYNAEQYLRVLEVGKIENPEDKDKDKKDRREGMEEYRNIIAKVEEYYKIQATQLEQNMLDGKMTKFAYEDAIKENDKQLNLSLAAVRDAIADEEGAADRWMDRIAEMRRVNIGGANGAEVMTRIEETSNKQGGVAFIGKKLNAGSDEDRSVMSGMKKEAEVNRMNAQKIDVERYEKELKGMLERNPMGKITDQYLEQFQQMGLMFANLSADSQESLRALCQEVMSVYLQIGKKVGEFDITSTDGLKAFRDYVSQLPQIGEAAGKVSEEKLRSLYYETYQYAETYSEQITKLIERQKKVWDKMYEQTREHIASVARQHQISQQMNGSIVEGEDSRKARFGSNQLTNFGGSSRLSMQRDVELKQEALADAENKWNTNISHAKNAVAARQQDYDNMQLKYAKGEATQDDVEIAHNALDEAQQQLEVISAMPNDVQQAVDALTASMLTLQEATMDWVSGMEKAFETFMDSFVPFRSWYEDKGSFADNVFGTKEERKKAFGAFMDDVKKTVRESIKEKVRLRVQSMVEDKLATIFHKEKKAEEVAADATAATASQTIKTTTTQTEMMTDNLGTANAMANDSKELVTGFWSNFGKAISKCFGDLGPVAGAVAAGVVSASLGALLTMVMNMMGSGSEKPAVATKSKLVTGMLTYDSGNVQSFPVMGDDGRVYNVSHAQDELQTGLVTKPTLTTVNGQPALVGERGPEMVIGRETTRAMMMYAPDLLQQISLFDRHRSNGKIKTYDEGNASAFAGAMQNSQPTDRVMTGDELREMMLGMQAALAQSNEVNARLAAQLQRGIKASINKYGPEGLVEEVASGFVESRQLRNNKNITRLFG